MKYSIIFLIISSFVDASNLSIVQKGILDRNTNKIINKYITTIPTTYFFYIDKKNSINGIYKEVRLGSSQAKCFAPIYHVDDLYTIENIYCYDRELSENNIRPIFYIYKSNSRLFRDFTYETPDGTSYTYGKKRRQDIIFEIVKNSIICTVPGKDFYNSNFDQFKCKIVLNKIFDTEALKYIDQFILTNTLNSYPITPQTLTQYNNIAYYLQKAGANEEAIYLLEKIIKKFPNRTVAYINLGDAYWALGEKQKAKKAYTTYIEQMCTKGLQKKIPKQVLERIKQNKPCNQRKKR